jgi:hypothetical protein
MLRRLNYRFHGAAITVSRAYRAHTIHSRLQSLLYWNRFTMALRIQRLYRGYVVRKQYYRLIMAQRKREELRQLSATKIQSIVRLRCAQRLFYEMQEAKRERNERRLRRKRKKLKEKYLKLGEYKFNMTSAIRNSREILRGLMPLRYIWGQLLLLLPLPISLCSVLTLVFRLLSCANVASLRESACEDYPEILERLSWKEESDDAEGSLQDSSSLCEERS